VPGGWLITDADRNVPAIARVYDSHGEGEANLALFMAAPELLEACQRMLDVVETLAEACREIQPDSCGPDSRAGMDIAAARAAIAKATDNG